MKNIVKRFPGALANDQVSLAVRSGEIHVLLGENGAGKSTLMQILYGFYAMDSGEIFIDGVPVRIESPKDAIALGIGMVHQEFMLVQPFSVIENTVLGLRGAALSSIDLPAAVARLKELSDRYGLSLDPFAQIRDLPIGVQQRVEIMKLLYRDACLLVLDEPTAVLTPQEKDKLFAVLRKLREGGRSVILVTHKLGEIMELADRVTVMRDGRTIDTLDVAKTSESELARKMVGREVNLRFGKPQQSPGDPVLQIENLHVRDDIGREKVRGVSLEVRAGEILGIAGVDGNGQSELAEAVMNLRPAGGGRVLFNGLDVTKLSVAAHRRAGLSYVPADRRGVGSVSQMTVADNAILGGEHRSFFRDIRADREAAEALATRFGLRAASMDAPAGKLSGGNLQKLILGREIMRGSKALVVEHPTRGLDVGAIESVREELLDARSAGKAILVISAELEELLNLADRVAVIFEGRIMDILDPSAASLELIGALMAGIAPGGAPKAASTSGAHFGEAL